MRVARIGSRAALSALVLATLGLAGRGKAEPLDLGDPTARSIVVEFETSSDLSTVGAQFGEPVPATYSVAGGLATIEIAGETFEALASSGSFQVESSDIVIEIDTATGSGAVVSASGTATSPFAAYTWSWTLDTGRTGGWIDGASLGPLYCESQAQVDELCGFIPSFCGATCEIVPGAVYAPGTGTINMVGFEFQDGCGESGCLAVGLFTGRGDLRLSEAASPVPLPALPLPGWLVGCLGLVGCWLLRQTAGGS